MFILLITCFFVWDYFPILHWSALLENFFCCVHPFEFITSSRVSLLTSCVFIIIFIVIYLLVGCFCFFVVSCFTHRVFSYKASWLFLLPYFLSCQFGVFIFSRLATVLWRPLYHWLLNAVNVDFVDSSLCTTFARCFIITSYISCCCCFLSCMSV